MEDALSYFYQYTYSREEDALAQQCILYFDKLIDYWSQRGFVLVCDSTNSGIYQMQSDIYIHQCREMTRILAYNPKVKVMVSQGYYKNRSIEVISIYTDIGRDLRKGFIFGKDVLPLFLDG